MADPADDVLAALLALPRPAGVSIERDGDVVRVVATPLGRLDVAVIAGIAVGIPAIVLLLFPSVKGVVAALVFGLGVLAIGFQRFAALRCVTVDARAGRLRVQHANPRAGRWLGLTTRDVAFTEVADVHVTRTMPAARTEPHGRRVSLRLVDATHVIVTEYTDPAAGAAFARAFALLLGAPVAED